jgi:hypothetical protein
MALLMSISLIVVGSSQSRYNPRLVHVIKSFNSHLQGSIPTTLSGVLGQVASAKCMIHSLSGKDAMGLGGFRIEVTVRAVSLREATKVVKRTGFLNPEYWLGLGDGPHAPKPISAKVVSRQAFLDNANWVFQPAESAKVFRGQGATKPSKLHIQALTEASMPWGGMGTSDLRQSHGVPMPGGIWWHPLPLLCLAAWPRSIRPMIRSGLSLSWLGQMLVEMAFRARVNPTTSVTATKSTTAGHSGSGAAWTAATTSYNGQPSSTG